ncbi:hypothetical protein [Streptomyces sp. NPDC021115]
MAADPDDLDIAFEHAMLVSRTTGLPEARERWTTFEELLAEHGDERDPQTRAAGSIISRAALGDWAGAGRFLAELPAARPYWEVVDHVVRALDDLAEAPGADRDRVAALRTPLADLRAALHMS